MLFSKHTKMAEKGLYATANDLGCTATCSLLKKLVDKKDSNFNADNVIKVLYNELDKDLAFNREKTGPIKTALRDIHSILSDLKDNTVKPLCDSKLTGSKSTFKKYISGGMVANQNALNKRAFAGYMDSNDITELRNNVKLLDNLKDSTETYLNEKKLGDKASSSFRINRVKVTTAAFIVALINYMSQLVQSLEEHKNQKSKNKEELLTELEKVVNQVIDRAKLDVEFLKKEAEKKDFELRWEKLKNVNKVILPDYMPIIANELLDGFRCTEMILPTALEYIGHYTFKGCKNLKRIVLPNKVKNISPNAFSDSALTEIDMSQCSVELIDHSTFSNATKLVDVKLPESLTKISNNAFEGCNSLPNIDIPKKVTELGEKCFSGCSNLKTIEIKGSNLSVGNNAFAGCTNIEALNTPKEISLTLGENCFDKSIVSRLKVNGKPVAKCDIPSIKDYFAPPTAKKAAANAANAKKGPDKPGAVPENLSGTSQQPPPPRPKPNIKK